MDSSKSKLGDAHVRKINVSLSLYMSFKQPILFWIFAHYILVLDKCTCYFSIIIIIMWLYKKLSGFYGLCCQLFELVLSFLSYVTWVEDSQVL